MSIALIDTQEHDEPTKRPFTGLLAWLGHLFRPRERAVYLERAKWKTKRKTVIWDLKAKKGRR